MRTCRLAGTAAKICRLQPPETLRRHQRRAVAIFAKSRLAIAVRINQPIRSKGGEPAPLSLNRVISFAFLLHARDSSNHAPRFSLFCAGGPCDLGARSAAPLAPPPGPALHFRKELEANSLTHCHVHSYFKSNVSKKINIHVEGKKKTTWSQVKEKKSLYQVVVPLAQTTDFGVPASHWASFSQFLRLSRFKKILTPILAFLTLCVDSLTSSCLSSKSYASFLDFSFVVGHGPCSALCNSVCERVFWCRRSRHLKLIILHPFGHDRVVQISALLLDKNIIIDPIGAHYKLA